MNKKRLLGIILSIILVLGLTPAVCMTARADEPPDYHLFVGDEHVTGDNLSGDNWSFTPATDSYPAKLSLNGVNITSDSNYGVIYYGDGASNNLTIELSGTNILRNTGTGGDGIFSFDKDITITGSGTLTVSGNYGIYTNSGSITISGGTVTATGSNYGINAKNTVTISGGTVSATAANNYGIYAESNIVISGGIITASGYDSGVCSDTGGISFSGGETTATADGNRGFGIFSRNNLTISGENTVVKATATGDSSNGIKSNNGITINCKEVTASGKDCGLSTVLGTISISGGTVNASGVSYYGIATIATDKTTTISGGSVTASGGAKAIKSLVINEIKGTGWSNTAGTEGTEVIGISTEARELNYLKVQFPCPAATVTTPPQANTLTYNKVAQNLVTAGTADANGKMEYAFGTDENTAPTSGWSEGIPQKIDAGTYYVWYRAQSKTTGYDNSDSKCVPVTIGKASATITPLPTGKTLTYNGSEQELVAPGVADENGTMQYVVSDSATTAPDSGWSTDIPKRTDAKTYYVWYRAKANTTDNYKDSTPAYVTATIKSRPAPTPVAPSAVVKTAPVANTLTYDGQPQELVTAGEAKGGTMQYALGKNNSNMPTSGWSESIPTGTEAGGYFVWYKAKGDSSHTNSIPKCITATIEKVPASVTNVPTVKVKTLLYNGEPKELVTSGEASGGTMQYALETSETTAPEEGWSEELPTVTDAGTYYIWYRVVGDDNHEDLAPSYVGVATIIENHSDNVLAIDFEKGIATVKDDVTGGTTEVPLYIITEGLIYRMYDPNRGEHFYTKDPEEAELLVQLGWIHESGSDFTVVSATDEDAIPVYRLYNPHFGGMHFYTTDAEEAKYLESIGWNYEGISHYVYAASSTKGTPQYRLYNPNSPSGEHNWTSDEAEVAMLIEAGWINEGICWQIV